MGGLTVRHDGLGGGTGGLGPRTGVWRAGSGGLRAPHGGLGGGNGGATGGIFGWGIGDFGLRLKKIAF